MGERFGDVSRGINEIKVAPFVVLSLLLRKIIKC